MSARIADFESSCPPPDELVGELLKACSELARAAAAEERAMAFLRLREAAIAARDLEREWTALAGAAGLGRHIRVALSLLVRHANAHVYTFMTRPPERVLTEALEAARAVELIFSAPTLVVTQAVDREVK